CVGEHVRIRKRLAEREIVVDVVRGEAVDAVLEVERFVLVARTLDAAVVGKDIACEGLESNAPTIGSGSDRGISDLDDVVVRVVFQINAFHTRCSRTDPRECGPVKRSYPCPRTSEAWS